MNLQSLPQEILYKIFSLLEQEELHYFVVEKILKTETLYQAAKCILEGSHVVVSNLRSSDFVNRNRINSNYMDHIVNVINQQDKNKNFYQAPIHVVSSMEKLKFPAPKTLTLYLLYPGIDVLKTSAFVKIITQFIQSIENSDKIFQSIAKINVYYDYNEFFANDPTFHKPKYNLNSALSDNVLDLSLFGLIHKMEKTCFESDVIKQKLTNFSVNTYIEDSRFQIILDNGIPFDESMIDMPQLKHLSLTYHTFGNQSILKGIASKPLHMPKFLASLNLSHSAQIVEQLITSGTFPPFLECLNLSACSIGKILETQIVQFPSTIKLLNLSSNQIKSLDNLKLPFFLETLDISNNQIFSLTRENGIPYEFPLSLLHMDLSYNYLDSLSRCNTRFPPNLIKLSLSANYLFDSTEQIHFPNTLIYLDLSLNKYRDFNGFPFPTQLRELDISNNLVQIINNGTFPFQWQETIRMFDFSNNPLEKFELFNISLYNKIKAVFINNIDLKQSFSQALKKGTPIQFPDTIEFLHLQNTGLTPSCFQHGQNLQILNIS